MNKLVENENLSDLRRKNKIDALKHSLVELEREWNRKNLTVEIATAEAGRVIENQWERDIQEYSLSSSNRRRFLMYCIRAAYDERPISWKQLIQLLDITRNGLETMIDECVENKWITEIKGKRKTHSKYVANENLIKTYDNYSAWVRRSCKNVGLRTVAGAIIQLQALIEIEVSERN